MGAKATQPAVLEYLTKNADVHVYVHDICRNTNLNKQSVLSAISRIKAKHPNLETISAGNQWIWRSKVADEKKGKRLFEELAQTRSGEVLVQDEEGAIYKLTEL